jgi:hypothetical protein
MRIGVLRPGIALSAVAGLWLWAEILALAAPLPPFRRSISAAWYGTFRGCRH